MTENEAIDKLNNLHYKIVHTSFCNKVYESEIEALCMAKDCLKEIQQHRAIGTVKELEEAKMQFDNINSALTSVSLLGMCGFDEAKEHMIETAKALKSDNIPIIHGKAELELHDRSIRAKAIDEFVSSLIPRLPDAIYPKDVEGMTNLINDVARELKAGHTETINHPEWKDYFTKVE